MINVEAHDAHLADGKRNNKIMILRCITHLCRLNKSSLGQHHLSIKHYLVQQQQLPAGHTSLPEGTGYFAEISRDCHKTKPLTYSTMTKKNFQTTEVPPCELQ